MDIKTIFAHNLKKELIRTGITQKELATKLKLPPTTINTWARGCTFPHCETLQAVADILKTTPSKLIMESTDNYQIDDSDKYMLMAINSSTDRRRLIDICLQLPEEKINSAISILNTVSNL